MQRASKTPSSNTPNRLTAIIAERPEQPIPAFQVEHARSHMRKNKLVPSGHDTVDWLWGAIDSGELSIASNLIPHAWYKWLRSPGTRSGPYWLAANVLAEIVYRYRGFQKRDDDNGQVRIHKQFASNCYIFNRKELAKRFDMHEEVISRALDYLANDTELRAKLGGQWLIRKTTVTEKSGVTCKIPLSSGVTNSWRYNKRTFVELNVEALLIISKTPENIDENELVGTVTPENDPLASGSPRGNLKVANMATYKLPAWQRKSSHDGNVNVAISEIPSGIPIQTTDGYTSSVRPYHSQAGAAAPRTPAKVCTSAQDQAPEPEEEDSEDESSDQEENKPYDPRVEQETYNDFSEVPGYHEMSESEKLWLTREDDKFFPAPTIDRKSPKYRAWKIGYEIGLMHFAYKGIRARWTEKGFKNLCHFLDETNFKYTSVYRVVAESWIAYADFQPSEKNRYKKGFWHTFQVSKDVNEIFREMPTSNQYAIMGAAQELGHNMKLLNSDENVAFLKKHGIWAEE